MRLSYTLSVYFGRQFLIGLGIVFFVLTSLVILFDLVELLRRAAGRDAASFWIVVQMAALRLPFLAQKVLPFAVLLGGMLAFSRLTRSHQLVIARATGVSVWQFLLPALVAAGVIGGLVVTVVNPFSSVMVKRYEQMEARYLRGRASMLAISSSGLWLRQADADGETVVHALRVSQRDLQLHDVIIFMYQGRDRFVGRIDAASAKLRTGFWEIRDALLTAPDKPARFVDTYRLDTDLTFEKIQESFAPPETMSFWALPAFIRNLEAAGFSGLRHRLYWHAVLAGPLLLVAMVLVAATFSLRLTRRGGVGLLIAGGAIAGFLLQFLSDIVFALGLSGSLPAVLAAWTPAGVSALLGVSLLFHLEDG